MGKGEKSPFGINGLKCIQPTPGETVVLNARRHQKKQSNCLTASKCSFILPHILLNVQIHIGKYEGVKLENSFSNNHKLPALPSQRRLRNGLGNR